MKILAMDTSTEVAGIVLLEEGQVRFSHRFLHRMDLSKRLLPSLQWLLQDAGLALSDVDTLGVGLGPGSFTGVRIGVTTMKTLAQVNGLPVVGVGTLEVMAAGCAPCPGALVCPCIDARKQEVYAGIYRLTAAAPEELMAPAALPAAALALRLADFGKPAIACGTGAVRYHDVMAQALGDRLHYASGHDFPDPVALAHLALRRLERGERDDPLALVPVYARLSEAERNLAGKGTGDEGRGTRPGPAAP